MRTLSLIVTVLTLHTSLASAQTTSFLSIPSSGFTPDAATGDFGYTGNDTGTARFFDNAFYMFAPVALPHGAKVTALRCGGKASSPEKRIAFTLRRNEAQVANVDMATVKTTFEGAGFQHPRTTSISSPVVDNANFNYYMVAEIQYVDVSPCPTCSVGYCRIRYTIGGLVSLTPADKKRK